ncbi:MAG: histidinol-phosphate transaminase [Emergencia sp.]
MSKFLNERYRKLQPYQPGEQPKIDNLIKLNTNESPYPPGQGVVEAVNQQVIERLRLYPDPECAALKTQIAGIYGMKKENVYVANGSDDILNFAFMAFADDRNGVMFPEISYGFYQVFAKLHGIPMRKIPLKEDFSIDPLAYTGQGAMIVIANPNAPTGTTLALYQIEEIVRTNPESVVVIDEAYIDFGGESCVDLVHKYDNLLVVQTFSKSRSLAGARLGFAIGAAGLISDLERIRYATNPYNVNSMTMAAGIAALQEEAYYRANCAEIVKTREKTAEGLKNLGFSVVPSKANFLFVKSDRIDGQRFYQEMRNAGVLIRHFDTDKIRDYNRVTIGTPKQMDTFLDTAEKILRKASHENK